MYIFCVLQLPGMEIQNQQDPPPMKRKLSKREKKELKKKEKEAKLKGKENEHPEGVAEKLYNDLPDTSFTRTISNPEVVMRRRRQQKLEKKLQEIRSRDDQGKRRLDLSRREVGRKPCNKIEA